MAYEDNGLRDHLLDHIADYITANNGNLGKKTGPQMIRCILPGHNDSGPSFRYYPDTRSFYCYGCRRGGNLIDLIGYMEGKDNKEAYQEAIRLYGYLYPDLVEGGPLKTPYSASESGKGAIYQKEATEAPRPIRRAINGDSEERARERAEDIKNALEEMALARKEVEEGRAAEAKAYLEGRGLNYDFAAARGIGYINGRIYYPGQYPGGFFYIKKTTRKAQPKALISKGEGIASILNASYLEDPTADYVFIVEGPEDMLSIEQYGHPAVAVSASLIQKIFELIDQGHYYKDPNRFFIISMDPDQAGRTASADLVKGLNERGIRAVAVDISGTHKDPNDNLTKGGEDNFRNTLGEAIEKAAAMAQAEEEPIAGSEPGPIEAGKEKEQRRKDHEKNRASERLPAMLEKTEARRDEPQIGTGFKTLDKALGGGIEPGLYILGAEPSTGKTTLALQMADYIAAKGNDVLFFTTEMGPDTLMARSLSRLSHKAGGNKDGLSAREILNGYKLGYVGNEKGEEEVIRTEYSLEERQNLTVAIEKYSAYSPRIYYIDIEEGLTYKAISREVEKHLELEGGKPFIVIDYLQMLTPDNPRLDFRLNLDAAIKGLKRLCNGHGLSILAVSSVNRAAYGTDAKMSAYKETSQIEYQAEVLMALQPQGAGSIEEGTEADMEDHRAQAIRSLELKILKARDGETGGVINLSYYAKYNTFEDNGPGKRGNTRTTNKPFNNKKQYGKKSFTEYNLAPKK